jgi:hypothetical protein
MMAHRPEDRVVVIPDDASIGDVVRIAAGSIPHMHMTMSKREVQETIAPIVHMLQCEQWFMTAGDARLALADPQIWQSLKVPGRLKIAIKSILEPMGAGPKDQDANVNAYLNSSTSSAHSSTGESRKKASPKSDQERQQPSGWNQRHWQQQQHEQQQPEQQPPQQWQAEEEAAMNLQHDEQAYEEEASLPLPPGWVEMYDDYEQAVYYHNAETDASSWYRPAAPPPPPSLDPLPAEPSTPSAPVLEKLPHEEEASDTSAPTVATAVAVNHEHTCNQHGVTSHHTSDSAPHVVQAVGVTIIHDGSGGMSVPVVQAGGVMTPTSTLLNSGGGGGADGGGDDGDFVVEYSDDELHELEKMVAESDAEEEEEAWQRLGEQVGESRKERAGRREQEGSCHYLQLLAKTPLEQNERTNEATQSHTISTTYHNTTPTNMQSKSFLQHTCRRLCLLPQARTA